MTRRKLLLSLGAIAALQGMLWLGYRLVTAARRPPADASSESRSGEIVPVHAKLQRRDGSATTLSALAGSRPVLLHFWASWCVPCQKELPTLLELSRSKDRPPGLELVLVSLDEEWRPVEAFFDGALPDLVLRDGGKLARAAGVKTLPDTYLLGPGGTQIARFRGARDWNAPELKGELARLLRRP